MGGRYSRHAAAAVVSSVPPTVACLPARLQTLASHLSGLQTLASHPSGLQTLASHPSGPQTLASHPSDLQTLDSHPLELQTLASLPLLPSPSCGFSSNQISFQETPTPDPPLQLGHAYVSSQIADLTVDMVNGQQDATGSDHQPSDSMIDRCV